jgi:hypothetical protein
MPQAPDLTDLDDATSLLVLPPPTSEPYGRSGTTVLGTQTASCTTIYGRSGSRGIVVTKFVEWWMKS